MKKIYTNNFFTENRLVMQQRRHTAKRISAAEKNRAEIDAALFGSVEPNPVEAAKRKAKRAMDAKQKRAFEMARKSSVEQATKKIYRIVNTLEKDRVTLERLAKKNKDPVAHRVALEYLFRALDQTGARGKGAYKIQKPNFYSSGTMEAILSQAVENLFANEFRINDITDTEDYNSLEKRLDRVSKRGKGAKGRNEVWKRYNKFATLANAVGIMKMELS